MVLVVLLCASLLALFFSYRSYTSASERVDTMETELTAAKAELVKAKKSVSNLDELKAELSDLRTRIERGGVDFPDKTEYAQMATSLHQLAGESNVEIVNYNGTWTTRELGDTEHPVFSYQLTARGEPLRLASFLREITDFPTMLVQNLSLEREENAWTMNVEMAMYLAPETGEQE